VLSTVDRTVRLHPDLCSFLVGTVRGLLPLLCAPASGPETMCRFEVDGQVWTTRVGDGKLEETSPSSVADVTIRTDASTFLLLVTMRQTLTECADRVTIGGVPELAEHVLSVSCFRV
jgi:hypothetical protein